MELKGVRVQGLSASIDAETILVQPANRRAHLRLLVMGK